MDGVGYQTGFSQTGAGIKVMLAGVFFPLGADSFIRRWVYIHPAQEQSAFNQKDLSFPKGFLGHSGAGDDFTQRGMQKAVTAGEGNRLLELFSNPLPKYCVTGRLMTCPIPEGSLMAGPSYCSRSADTGHGPR